MSVQFRPDFEVEFAELKNGECAYLHIVLKAMKLFIMKLQFFTKLQI